METTTGPVEEHRRDDIEVDMATSPTTGEGMPSLFTPLEHAGLTSLRVQHDWRTGDVRLAASRDWEPELDFAEYNSAFYADSILTSSSRHLNTAEVRELFDGEGLSEYLSDVLDLLRQGRHFGMEAYFHADLNIRFVCHQHSRRQGIFNRRHAILAGGIRRHPLEEEELDVLIDGLNLSRAMSFKNIAADLDFGGSKTTVQMDALNLDDMKSLGFLSYALDRCRTMTGPDMNFPTAMADVINEHFSAQFTNGPSSPLGESGRPTAYGTYLALKEAVRYREGTDSLVGKSVAVMGLGAVGWHLAEHLYAETHDIHVADVDQDRVAAFIREHPGTREAPVDRVLELDVDIIAPAAIGGILDEQSIDRLRCRYVFGPANNQLRASNQADEERLARRLADRGILFQTEWWHNTGGVMCGAEEYIRGKSASYDTLVKRIDATIPAKTAQNLNDAAARGITPTENAYRTCADIIYGS